MIGHMGRWLRRAPRLLGFLLWYCGELAKANALVVIEVVRPRYAARPVIVRVPLRKRSAAHVTAFAHLISLTPGTLVVDIDERCRHLYVHGLHFDDADHVRAALDTIERRLIRTFE